MFAQRLLLALAALLVGACSASDPLPYELVHSQGVYSPPWPLLSGGGSSDVIGYGSWNGSTGFDFQFVRHDLARPDALVDLGTVTVVGRPDRFAMSRTMAVVGWGPDVTLIDFAGPSLGVATATLEIVPDHVVAEGGWLLASESVTLQLVSLEDPAVRFSFTASDPVTSLLPVSGSFLAFTATGYVHVGPDATTPTFSNRFDESVRAFERGYVDGAGALVAGPSSTLGRSRIARLDLSTPGSPIVVGGTEVDRNFSAFAWNGGATSILEIEDEEGVGTYEGYLVREVGGQFESTPVVLPLWVDGSVPHIAMHGDRLFVMELASGAMRSTYRIR